jgi:hypothetical protein
LKKLINPAGFLFPVLCLMLFFSLSQDLDAQIPSDYKGKPFYDDTLGFKGPQVIPGRVELAYYDFGGEGIAYHDSTAVNDGSKLNHQCFDYGCHRRPGVPWHIAFFRENEGVDISYTKDWADYKKPNVVEPMVNQLYIGWEANGEWTNYTVDVKSPGTYRIITVYANDDNNSELWLNNKFACKLYLPKNTGYYHQWDQATIGEIQFPSTGVQLLTLKYNRGPNLAYLDFVKVN